MCSDVQAHNLGALFFGVRRPADALLTLRFPYTVFCLLHSVFMRIILQYTIWHIGVMQEVNRNLSGLSCRARDKSYGMCLYQSTFYKIFSNQWCTQNTTKETFKFVREIFISFKFVVYLSHYLQICLICPVAGNDLAWLCLACLHNAFLNIRRL